MPSFRNKSRRVISAPADRVFEYLSDLDSYAKWAMSDPYTVKKTSRGPLGPGSTFLAELSVTTLGQKLDYAGVTLMVKEFVSNERIAFQMGDHEGGAWTRESCDLQPVAGGTEVTLTFEMAVPNRALAISWSPSSCWVRFSPCSEDRGSWGLSSDWWNQTTRWPWPIATGALPHLRRGSSRAPCWSLPGRSSSTPNWLQPMANEALPTVRWVTLTAP